MVKVGSATETEISALIWLMPPLTASGSPAPSTIVVAKSQRKGAVTADGWNQ